MTDDFDGIDRGMAAALAFIEPVPGIERFHCPDDAYWHLLRKHDTTASVAGALIGEHEFTTPYKMFAEKSGKLAPEDLSNNDAVLRGEILEDAAVKWLRKKRPGWTIQHNSGADRIYYRDPVARLGATPDILVFDPERGNGVIQVKSVAAMTFKNKWCADGAPVPPLWIAIQAIVEASLTGAKWAAVAPFWIDDFGRMDMPLIDIPLNAGIMDRLREASIDFWKRIERDDPPPADYVKDQSTLLSLYGADDGSTIDLTGWNQGPELAAEDDRLAKEIKERKDRRDAIKAEVLDKIGAAAVAMIDGRVFVTAKTTKRKGYTVKDTEYRSVNFKRSA